MKKQVKVENATYDYAYEYEYDGNEKKNKKDRIPLTHRTVAKVFAFILAVVVSVVTTLSILLAVWMVGEKMYMKSSDQCKRDVYFDLVEKELEELEWHVYIDTEESAERYIKEKKNIKSVVLEIKSNDSKKKFSYQAEMDMPAYKYEFGNSVYDDEWGEEYTSQGVVYVYKQAVDYKYVAASKFIDFCYANLYQVYPVAFVGVVIIILCAVFLFCGAGRKKGHKEVQPGWGTKIPFDLLTIVTGAVFIFLIAAAVMTIEEFPPGIDTLAFMIIVPFLVALLLSIVLGWLMSFILRIKLGKWWENTAIFRLLKWISKIGKGIIKRIAKSITGLFKYIIPSVPLVWKTALILLVIILTELVIVICSRWEPDNQIIWFYISSIVIGTAVLYCAVMIKKLQQGNQEIANGNFDYRVDTNKMFGDFKKHGEAINSIAEGMNLAVAKQLKSERMKTELITNVSHDIKTPLTSIINYTDLIEKEPCENEKIKEYSKVLLRQSDKLKRLIDDLVEVSKATTGNMEVNLSACEVNIFIDQVAGEYQEKLQERNIELITAIPENPVKIMADGRRLWRIFDNLINNVFKYAQSNTRVYLSLEEQKGEAVITLKNISQSPLNITADELMERFVRGDSSRNTEGNGLGLSIARSLTELQKGTFEIAIDGDLFKAILKFPIE